MIPADKAADGMPGDAHFPSAASGGDPKVGDWMLRQRDVKSMEITEGHEPARRCIRRGVADKSCFRQHVPQASQTGNGDRIKTR